MGRKDEVSQVQSNIYHSSLWKGIIQADEDGYRSPKKITTPFIDKLVRMNPHLLEKRIHQFKGLGSPLSISFGQRLDIPWTASDLFLPICLNQPPAQPLLFFSGHNNKFPWLEIDGRGG